jgi:transcription elongation factor GreA
MISRYPITELGKALLLERITELRQTLPSVREELMEAQKKGDFSENFEYHAAKKHLRELEFQIEELDKYIKSTDIIKLPSSPSIVCFGAKVTLARQDISMGNCGTSGIGSELQIDGVESIQANKNLDDKNAELNKERPDIVDYVIVGDREAEPSMGSLSNRSPLFQVLVAKKVGEKVNFNHSTYIILKIEASNENELKDRIRVS